MKEVENHKLKKILEKIYIHEMDKKVISFDDTKIEKCKFHKNKSLILINNIDINKIVVSNKVSSGKNSFK